MATCSQQNYRPVISVSVKPIALSRRLLPRSAGEPWGAAGFPLFRKPRGEERPRGTLSEGPNLEDDDGAPALTLQSDPRTGGEDPPAHNAAAAVGAIRRLLHLPERFPTEARRYS